MKAAGPEDDGRKRSRESSAEPRRTHRKTESRVLFSDVQAQNREMERINYEKSRHHADTAAPTQLRKGETQESPAKSSKQKRAEERRSKRQKLRRNMSPRSPDGGPQPLRGGVSLVKLDGDITQRKRRFARDEDAIQDASLHSTAWRNLKFAEAPANLLPDREEITKPYALEFDVPLEEFDDELKLKCAVSSEFLKPKPLTMASGTRGEVKEELQVEERVKQLIEEATPLVKKCHAVRANAIVANTRQQIATYLDQRSMMLEKAFELTGVPLKVSRLEKIAARRLLRNAEYAPDAGDRPHYSVGRTESDHSGHVYPEVVTYLSKIAPIPRSTTCMLSCGTQRVEDDPIIRFVPYFSAKSAKNKDPQFSSTGRCKDTLVGMDDEVNEYILRYVVNSCGGDQAVLEALQRCGAFMQPFANYSDVVERVTREELFKKHVQELKSQQNNAEISARRNRTIDALLEECLAVRTGANLRGRLQPLPAHILFNHLLQVDSTGVRNAPSEQYRELGIKYQDFFCRRCVAYNCRNHGREQPVPVVRVDPSYPEVKATKRLWRRVEEEQLEEEEETIDDADVEMEGYSPENGESINTAPNNTSQDKREQSAQSTGNASGFEATRRSMRAQTAASTKASSASSRVNAVRLHVRKLVRSKTSDASEYLGFDGIYQALTQDRKLELLSADLRCGPHCSKSVTDTAEASESNGFGVGAQGKPWGDSEIALLNKLEVCVGPNACVVAALLTTRSCTDVAQYLRERERRAQSGHKLGMIRSGVYGQNRERSNGVLGNSFEHLRRTRSQRMKDRGANHEYVPCNHDGGSCDSAQCSCMRRDHYCEKSCGCSPDCSNRFPGCHCEVGQCRTVECPCYFASRECDPDVCTSCGACELPVVVADEEKKGKTVAQLKICGNVNIMRGQMRKIGVSASETHGWGAYALENVKKGEFMYEYTGSLLSQDEAERRGNVYDKTTISFLFDLTEDSVVDATRKGNKSKFANHDSVNPKCFARIMLVNGDHRIGIYAKEDISVGDELFFDYGYSGVIPDWSQARIGFSKETASVEDDAESKPSAIDVKEEVEA
ncbi:Histone-lysine N-methyltransferase EZH1 [Phytophthora citrophthora]|uniref:Histone-lysine N-methyltransferase EZH1 n=1 Tax=Phytophthora citrophthora TaxID=4793 RepID=A0AAD9GGJ1_9STRA|nr:Histone-lysine N-methyltransferase EZH1 [Phytophthora citrophthora]